MGFLSPFLCAGLLFFWQLLFALQVGAVGGDPAGLASLSHPPANSPSTGEALTIPPSVSSLTNTPATPGEALNIHHSASELMHTPAAPGEALNIPPSVSGLTNTPATPGEVLNIPPAPVSYLTARNTEAGPGCVACAEGDPTSKQVADIHQLISREACRKMLKKKECVNVPDLLKADCEKSPTSMEKTNLFGTNPFVCVGSFMAGTVGFLAAVSKLMALPLSRMKVLQRFRPRHVFVAGLMAISVPLYISYLFEKAVKQSSHLARKHNWDRQTHSQYARARMLTTLREKVYNLTYNDSHCYNPAARGVRVCGVLGAVSGAGISSGVSLLGLGSAVGSTALFPGAAGAVAGTIASTGGILTGAGVGFFGGLGHLGFMAENAEQAEKMMKAEYEKTRQETFNKMFKEVRDNSSWRDLPNEPWANELYKIQRGWNSSE